MKVKVEGFRELEAQLERLKPATGKAALRRGGLKAMAPMAKLASELAPRDTGQLADSIVVSAKAVGAGANLGKKEYAAIMKRGGSKGEALTAMKDTRREAQASGNASHVELFMGPAKASDKNTAIKQIAQEFGTSKMEANPYMRPAWDRDQQPLLERVKDEIWKEIEKTIARAIKAGKIQ